MDEKLQMVYDFVKLQKKSNEDIANSLDDKYAKALFEANATSYWAVMAFIEENFIDNN